MNSENILGKVQLEFVYNSYGIKTYINVFCGKIPDYEQDPCKTWVSVKICDGEPEDFIAEKFEGGQKILLPEACSFLIINSLLREQPVSIELQIGEAIFHPYNFCKQWSLLLKD
jgi:hypothetical protein